MKIRNVASRKNQLKLKSLKGSLKLENVLHIFTVPDIDFISSLDINLSTHFY